MNGRASDEMRSRPTPAAACVATDRPRGRTDFQQAVDGLRRALDDAERDGAGVEHASQKERQERVDGLGRRIGREAHPPEQPDGAGKMN